MTLRAAVGHRDRHRRAGRRGALRGGASPSWPRGLLEIRDELRADAELAERVRRKFEIKNTMGYRLCAFLDADTPLEIFRRLVVGSEGTLAFIAEAVFETRAASRPHTTVSWLHFADDRDAVEPVPRLRRGRARRAVELMVRAGADRRRPQRSPGTPEHWQELPPESAALLVEFAPTTPTSSTRASRRGAARSSPATSCCARPSSRATHEAIELAWSVREGMFGLVGRLRPPGTR